MRPPARVWELCVHAAFRVARTGPIAAMPAATGDGDVRSENGLASAPVRPHPPGERLPRGGAR
ncbi:hypothetical protein [Nonomuraea sp. NPDC050643]|uniref:hypothetical protein n=1 Tax=Nonomuraea sp. NPDC050643 TaxID=3155660 RepID=UPI00340041C9